MTITWENDPDIPEKIRELGREDSEIREWYYRMQRLVFTEELTGLPNHRAFKRDISVEIEQCRNTGLYFCLLKIDLDRLKGLNDTYGHEAVDRGFQNLGTNLLAIGTNLLATTRQVDRRDELAHRDVERRAEQDRRQRYSGRTDRVYRLHGDEFAALLVDVTPEGLDHVYDRAHEIYRTIAKTPVTAADGSTAYISASIGVAVFPKDGDTAEKLLEHADKKLYKAKDLVGVRISGLS